MSRRKSLRALFFCGLSICLLFAIDSTAQIPDSLSFQGYLTDPGGSPMDTTLPMTFKLYKGSVEVWSNTVPAVVVDSGGFNVALGGNGLDTVAFNEPMKLGISVGGDAEISPRTSLTASAFALGMRGMYAVTVTDGSTEAVNIVGGSHYNYVSPAVFGATIGGGGGLAVTTRIADSVLASWGTVSGGNLNTAAGWASTVAGGQSNKARGNYSTVGGGDDNKGIGDHSTISGGRDNEASGSYSAVGGGTSNTASGGASTVGGGVSNKAHGSTATVPGGFGNRADGASTFAAGYKAKAVHDGSFVWNDRSITSANDSLISTGENQFLIRAVGGVGIGTPLPTSQLTVHGNLELDSTGAALIFPDGSIQTSAASASGSNWGLTGNSGTTPGTHFIGTTDSTAFEIKVGNSRAVRVVPGYSQVYTDPPNVILGDDLNGVSNDVYGATVSGGGGGAIGFNHVTGRHGTVGGGVANLASELSTAGGGGENVASGWASTVAGGSQNRASGSRSTIPGGSRNQARGHNSFAAGFEARAAHDGSFVWNDHSHISHNDSLVTTGPNQFLARAEGGFFFYTDSITVGATLAAGTGSWASMSDVNAKTGFNSTRPEEVLERLVNVPIQTWRYKGQDESITHMGPMAQDFYEAFGLGIDDKHIVTIDADGVAFAAIQGLYELVKDQQAILLRQNGEIQRMRDILNRAGLE